MKTLSVRFQSTDHKLVFRNRFEAFSAGVDATKDMKAKPGQMPDDLQNYFSQVGKGKYFSITKRREMSGNPEAKNGVIALQQVLKESGVFDRAEAALKDKNSDFRKQLENTKVGSGENERSLFTLSLQSFDRKSELFKGADGDYGHSTRLAVAYLQSEYGAKVDGAFGKNTMALLRVSKLNSDFQNTPDGSEEETRAENMLDAVDTEFKAPEVEQPKSKPKGTVETAKVGPDGPFKVGQKITQDKFLGGQNLYDAVNGKKIDEWPGNTEAEIMEVQPGEGGKYKIKFTKPGGGEVEGWVWKRSDGEYIAKSVDSEGNNSNPETSETKEAQTLPEGNEKEYFSQLETRTKLLDSDGNEVGQWPGMDNATFYFPDGQDPYSLFEFTNKTTGEKFEAFREGDSFTYQKLESESSAGNGGIIPSNASD